MNKIKALEVVGVGTVVRDAMFEVKPTLAVDLTEEQWRRLETKVVKRINAETVHSIIDHVYIGDSVEFKDAFNVRVSESLTVKNDNGSFRKKVSVKTRTKLRILLNGKNVPKPKNK